MQPLCNKENGSWQCRFTARKLNARSSRPCPFSDNTWFTPAHTLSSNPHVHTHVYTHVLHSTHYKLHLLVSSGFYIWVYTLQYCARGSVYLHTGIPLLPVTHSLYLVVPAYSYTHIHQVYMIQPLCKEHHMRHYIPLARELKNLVTGCYKDQWYIIVWLQEDKKSLISGSQSSSIFDNSIYKEPNGVSYHSMRPPPTYMHTTSSPKIQSL